MQARNNSKSGGVMIVFCTSSGCSITEECAVSSYEIIIAVLRDH